MVTQLRPQGVPSAAEAGSWRVCEAAPPQVTPLQLQTSSLAPQSSYGRHGVRTHGLSEWPVATMSSSDALSVCSVYAVASEGTQKPQLSG
jgi:hypothetical protein